MPHSSSPLLFEIAWEVCQQVGGIYTVLKTKVPAMLERWGENYCLIGPYNKESAAIEFEETSAEEPLRSVLRALKQAGIACYYGRWLVPGKPKVILLDHRLRHFSLDSDKYLLWKDHGIETAVGDAEVNDTISFGFTVFEFFKSLSSLLPSQPVIAHFHEWLSGIGLMRIAHAQLPVSTVFTTHATLLGRYCASDNPFFYEELDRLDAWGMARHYNIVPRFMIERIAAHASTVFTTISDITAREAERFLGRTPEVLLPNGINLQRFTALHEFQNLHLNYKEQIQEFVLSHFFPSYTLNLERTVYMFVSGRYEYRNKGMDIFIEGLYQLNQRLKASSSPTTVVAFIITKAPTRNINVGALHNRLMLDELRHMCSDIQNEIGNKLLLAACSGKTPNYEEIVAHDTQTQFKRATHAFRRTGLPPIVTHDLYNDHNDAILCHLRHRNLINNPDDSVKVVFHPDFITATNPLFGLDYDQFVRGCHLGVFPSYYEPWGYTPLECIALGIPAVTTDLSGFGSYVKEHLKKGDESGIHVLPRNQKRAEESIEDLTNHLFAFCQMTRRERIEQRNRAERFSAQFDWNVLATHYHQAHDLALTRVWR